MRYRPVVSKPFDPATDAMAPSDYAIRAILDGLDPVAHAMERKWGVGRLRLLVGDSLRARFDAQSDKLAAAIDVNSETHTPAQVALCLIDLKMARLVHAPNPLDSIVDVAGYAACLREVSR